MLPTNPYTQDLLERLLDPPPRLAALIRAWDRLETLVIAVFRNGEADDLDEARFVELATWLNGHYHAFEAELTAHWRAVRVGGKLLAADPFRALFEASNAAAFVDNWPAMQTLPAAREALNRFLVALGDEDSAGAG